MSLLNNNAVVEQYKHIAPGALKHAVELNSNGVFLKLETVIEMTKYPHIGIETIDDAFNTGYLILNEMELPYLNIVKNELDMFPNIENDLINMIIPTLEKNKFLPSEYGI